MSRKYYDKVLAGSGTSSVKVKSAFGAKILAKYGWSEGQGLGSSMNGVEECVQVERREERIGIGAEKKSESEWDNWWSGAYDSVAARIAVKVKNSERSVSTSSNDSETDEPVVVGKIKKKKKEKREEEPQGEPLHKQRRVKRHVRDEI
jgi:hypothetical protein